MTDQDKWEPPEPPRPSPKQPPPNPDVIDLVPIEERGQAPQ